MRELSEAAQLLCHVSSLNTLSIWLVEIANLKHVGLLQEYFTTVLPDVRDKYANQDVLSPTAKLVQHLMRGRETAADSTSD